MAKYATLYALFTAIANALRGKTGGTGNIVADDFPAVIDGLDTEGIAPTGTKTITSNGTHDVTNYASAVVNVPTPAQMTVVRTITLDSDITGTNALVTLLSNDDFIKQHYADEGFSATLFLATPVESATNVIHFVYQANRNVGSSNVARTGCILRSTGASAAGWTNCTTALSGKGYSSQLRAASDGSLKQYLSTGHILKAGAYLIVLTCTT